MIPPKLILKLHEINALKFGSFTLKNGIQSPIYIDLRIIISFPQLLRDLSDTFWHKIKHLDFDVLCGIPYTALPIATSISILRDKPMVIRRKEVKVEKKIIEGSFITGQNCIVIADIITNGTNIVETIEPLENEGLRVNDVAVLLDKEEGGQIRLAKRGYQIHSIFTLSEIINTLEAAGKLDKTMSSKVREYLNHSILKERALISTI